jgi:hypothetical protein
LFTASKEFVVGLIYSMSEAFGSYVITYVIFAVIMAIFGTIYSVMKSKNDRMCQAFAPYVRAVQVADIDKEKGSALLDRLYTENNFNAFPATLVSIIYICMCLIIFPSLFLVTGEGRDIPINFLWVSDITEKTVNIPMVVIYAFICSISRLVMTVLFDKMNKQNISSIIIGFVCIVLSAVVGSRVFSCLFLIYSCLRRVLQTAFTIIYRKCFSKRKEVIICDELKELRELTEAAEAAADTKNAAESEENKNNESDVKESEPV